MFSYRFYLGKCNEIVLFGCLKNKINNLVRNISSLVLIFSVRFSHTDFYEGKNFANMNKGYNLLKLIPLLSVLWLLSSCSGNPEKKINEVEKNPSISQMISKFPFVHLPYREVLSLDQEAQTPPSQDWKIDSIYINTLKPITGYRFIITGDFNGDGIKDTLTEHYINPIDRKETNKYYEGLDYDRSVTAAVHKDPFSFITCSNKRIDTLIIHIGGQLFGISYMKNEGDLDGDGGDEISYVVDWADWSSVNTCHVVSCKNGKWLELYSFETRDWVLPSLPDVQTEYGLFGVAGASSTIGNDTANKRILKELKAFPGLVTKLKSGKIKVQTFILAEDTTLIVDLRRR